MIKINLLGDETAIDHTGTFVALGYGASVLICLVVYYFLYSATTGRIDKANDDVANLKQQLETLKIRTKEVRELEAKKDELTMKLSLLAKLKRQKFGPVRVLDDLNQAMPEQAWVFEVREREGVLRVDGLATDNQTIADFMRRLESSDYFETVDLRETAKAWFVRNLDLTVPDSCSSYNKPGQMLYILKKNRREDTDVGLAEEQDECFVRMSPKMIQDAEDSQATQRIVKIKEFSIEAKVNFAGKLEQTVEDEEAAPDQEQPARTAHLRPNAKSPSGYSFAAQPVDTELGERG